MSIAERCPSCDLAPRIPQMPALKFGGTQGLVQTRVRPGSTAAWTRSNLRAHDAYDVECGARARIRNRTTQSPSAGAGWPYRAHHGELRPLAMDTARGARR